MWFFIPMLLGAMLTLLWQPPCAQASETAGDWDQPTALVVSPDGATVFVGCGQGRRVLGFDTAELNWKGSAAIPGPVRGLALSPDGRHLFVSCGGIDGRVCEIPRSEDGRLGLSRELAPSGHTPMGLAVSKEGATVYVCQRFSSAVGVVDARAGGEAGSIRVAREPVAAALCRDGRYLLVANSLHAGRADAPAAASISVVDVSADRVEKELRLPNGSGLLNDLRVSPDGQWAAVTHLVASAHRAAAQVKLGWMNGNALTLLDARKLEFAGTVLLDSPGSGAANPWGVAWTADSRTLVVAHAGTHEVSAIDIPALVEAMREEAAPGLANSKRQSGHEPGGTRPTLLQFVAPYEGMPAGLPFLVGARRRIRLPAGDLGPRAVVVAGRKAYVASYFSDTLSMVDLDQPTAPVLSFKLPGRTEEAVTVKDSPKVVAGGPNPQEVASTRRPRLEPIERLGEFYFHDATICLQGWQSCASCHPGGGRSDGLNWDLLNDGIGNPKNTKSLLWSHRTPPAMSLGVRETAETAVRSGIRHILFTQQPEEVAVAIDAYLKSLRPEPSPFLVRKAGAKGNAGVAKTNDSTSSGAAQVSEWVLSESAERGKLVFAKAGCAECHPAELFTDLQRYDVGTGRPFDKPGERFDTPSLVELWRTAPYLHDGSAATVRDVLTTRNLRDEHGQTSKLTPRELDNLCAYLLSL